MASSELQSASSAAESTTPVLRAPESLVAPHELHSDRHLEDLRTNAEHKAAFDILRAALEASQPPLSEEDMEHCDDLSLLRFLRARKWCPKKAEKALRDMLAWRRTFLPRKLMLEELMIESATGKDYVNGFDRAGRPILYLRPRCENTKNYENQLRLLVYHMELAIRLMPPGVETMTLLFDFEGYTTANAPPLSTSKETMNILANYYVERLGKALIINAPWIFHQFYWMFSPFIDPVTKAKVHFIDPHNEKSKEHLSDFIEPDTLEANVGGKRAFKFVNEDYWQAVQAIVAEPSAAVAVAGISDSVAGISLEKPAADEKPVAAADKVVEVEKDATAVSGN